MLHAQVSSVKAKDRKERIKNMTAGREQTIGYAEKCMKYIDKSVSCYHAISNAEEMLKAAAFTELSEKEEWKISGGGNYYVKRNGSSLIAFKIPVKEMKGFHIVAAHSDSPCFKLKENPEITVENVYTRLNTEPYGGMIYSTWFDKSLSVAGRLVCYRDGELKEINVCIDEDLLVIPSLAIHMNRDANKGVEYNPQVDLLPVIGSCEVKGCLKERLAQMAGVDAEDILGSDLFLYVRENGRRIGAGEEWILSPRLDDLECAYASLEGLLESEPESYGSICVIFDNEEVGSHTKQGAASTFLKDTLERICEAIGKRGSDYLRLLAESFMISADNAHGLHPNHPEKADPVNKPVLNGGIVIKHHGGQKYTTDGVSGAYVRMLCKEAKVPCQDYTNRSDVAGGSTLGNISAGQVSIPSADIGLAQLAMHSAVETAGAKDVEYMVRVLKQFYAK